MSFRVQHTHDEETMEPSDFATIKGNIGNLDVTQFVCTECNERIFMLGHEPFNSAQPINYADDNRQPGMILRPGH
jgi:hypothetical protein